MTAPLRRHSLAAMKLERLVGAAVCALLLGGLSTAASVARASAPPAPWDPARGILIEGATVVTMDDLHTVIPHGRVLVRDGRIVAVWSGPQPPDGVEVGAASVIEAGPRDLLFPGLIGLRDHPFCDPVEAGLP